MCTTFPLDHVQNRWILATLCSYITRSRRCIYTVLLYPHGLTLFIYSLWHLYWRDKRSEHTDKGHNSQFEAGRIYSSPLVTLLWPWCVSHNFICGQTTSYVWNSVWSTNHVVQSPPIGEVIKKKPTLIVQLQVFVIIIITYYNLIILHYTHSLSHTSCGFKSTLCSVRNVQLLLPVMIWDFCLYHAGKLLAV